MTDFDQLDIMRRAITALGLGQCAPEELVAEARASASRREQDRGMLADQRARIKDLESALHDLGVNPGGDLQGEVRAITNRIAANEAAAQHDLDCALRERDRAIDDARTATARIKDLEAKIATNIAEAAARDMRIADLERDLAAKDDALAQICEIVGAPAGVSPDAVVDGARMLRSTAQHAKVRATQAEATLKEINLALLDAGAPQAYTDDGEKHPIPPAERVLLLGERARAEHAERILEGDRADLYRQRLADVDLALDKRGASRLADDAPLPTAARLRSLTL